MVLYNVAEKEMAKFFAWDILKTYLAALYDSSPMYMCDVTAIMILAHLQKNTADNRDINILALQDGM